MRRHHALEDIPARLWRMVALARHRLLMLDYDGTLAPWTVARAGACKPQRTLELLERIARSTHTTLAIVSSRPLPELEQWLGGLPAIVVGEHGWEQRAADGRRVRRALEPAGAATPAASRNRIWEPLAVAGVALDHIAGDVDLHTRERNKGSLVLSLLSQAAPGTLGVFVGDDGTDEDAFEVVNQWGFGVRVGDVEQPSLAQGRLASCAAVDAFFEAWLEMCLA